MSISVPVLDRPQCCTYVIQFNDCGDLFILVPHSSLLLSKNSIW